MRVTTPEQIPDILVPAPQVQPCGGIECDEWSAYCPRPMIAHYVFRVTMPTLVPLPASAGQLLVVAPGDPHGNVSVQTPDASRVLRRGHVDEGTLYGLILGLDADGWCPCSHLATACRWTPSRSARSC